MSIESKYPDLNQKFSKNRASYRLQTPARPSHSFIISEKRALHILFTSTWKL